jgi:hypothetical protein
LVKSFIPTTSSTIASQSGLGDDDYRRLVGIIIPQVRSLDKKPRPCIIALLLEQDLCGVGA